jgi:hypothetical protein
MATLADLLRGGYTPPTTSALADPIKEHFRTLPQQLETNQRAMDKTMAGMDKTDIMGRPNPNYYPEAMQEFTQNYAPNFMGTFIGVGSKLWNPKLAFQAAKLEKQGVSPEEILKQTGTSRGLDNQFRQEISDENALIKGTGKFGDVYEQRKTAYGVTTPTVEEVMRHPELFEAYPQLKGNQVMLLPATSRNNASYSPAERIIRVNPNLTADQARSSMLHELQHGVQEIEGFNKGTDAGIFLKKYQEQADELEERLMQANKDLKLHAGGKYYDDLLKERDAIGKEYRDFMGADQQGVIRKATQEYKAYGGEAEARLTQARQKLTADQRKQIYPYIKGQNALDINPEDAIIKMENNSPTITRKELLQQLLDEQK